MYFWTLWSSAYSIANKTLQKLHSVVNWNFVVVGMPIKEKAKHSCKDNIYSQCTYFLFSRKIAKMFFHMQNSAEGTSLIEKDIAGFVTSVCWELDEQQRLLSTK